MKIIAITSYNRPTLLMSTLNSIIKLINVDQWKIFIRIDPSKQLDEILEIIQDFTKKGLSISYSINRNKVGIRKNPYRLLQWVFGAGADAVLYLEDDLLISDDSLIICEQILKVQNFNQDYLCANLLCMTCASNSVLVPPKEEYSHLLKSFFSCRFFSSLGIFITQYQFLVHFEPNWFNTNLRLRNFAGERTEGWDLALNDYLLKAENLRVLQSIVPRVCHRGVVGTHANYDFHLRTFSHLKLSNLRADIVNVRSNIDVIHEDDIQGLDESCFSYLKSYLNLALELSSLQRYSMQIEQRCKSKSAEKLASYEAELSALKTRLQKKSIRVAEFLATKVNKVLRRS